MSYRDDIWKWLDYKENKKMKYFIETDWISPYSKSYYNW